jgi:hypothetical protein
MEQVGLDKQDVRPYYLRRYGYPGFTLEAEYRLAARTFSIAVGTDRLYLTDNPPSKFGRYTPGLLACDLRALPPVKPANPPDLPVTRAALPGDTAEAVVADPAGGWAYVVAGQYHKFHVCRLPADLSAAPAAVELEATLHSPPFLSADGATVSVSIDFQAETTWVDIDTDAWRVRRRQTGDRRASPWRWVRGPERTFAADWDNTTVFQLEWDGPAARVEPVARVPLIDLRPTWDGRYVFLLCGGQPGVLRAVRADVRLPPGVRRPICGSAEVLPARAFYDRLYVAPDGAAVVVTTGEVWSVRYPAD